MTTTASRGCWGIRRKVPSSEKQVQTYRSLRKVLRTFYCRSCRSLRYTSPSILNSRYLPVPRMALKMAPKVVEAQPSVHHDQKSATKGEMTTSSYTNPPDRRSVLEAFMGPSSRAHLTGKSPTLGSCITILRRAAESEEPTQGEHTVPGTDAELARPAPNATATAQTSFDL